MSYKDQGKQSNNIQELNMFSKLSKINCVKKKKTTQHKDQAASAIGASSSSSLLDG
jgi:hypothetical protein